MAKKKRKKPAQVSLSVEQYARLLARGGQATLDMLDRYEAAVIADPQAQAEAVGATPEELVAGLVLLRALVDKDMAVLGAGL